MSGGNERGKEGCRFRGRAVKCHGRVHWGIKGQ